MGRFIDLTGQRFGRLVVLSKVKHDSDAKIWWYCRCDCGVEKDILGRNLRDGYTKSCGCLGKEILAEGRQRNNSKRGVDDRSRTRLYRIWIGMRQRCGNPNDHAYPLYGGRGIFVCTEWESNFQAFKEWSYANGYTDKLTIDRIDGNKGYYPENCRWADMHTQQNNTSRNIRIVFCGEERTISEWAEFLGIPYQTIWHRYEKGFPIDQVLGLHKMKKAGISCFGETHTLKEWSLITGIPSGTISNRIYRCGWSVEKALTEPIRKSNK